MESVGEDLMVDLSFLIVPVMTTAAVLPLLYFEICNRIIRFWSPSLPVADPVQGLSCDIIGRRPCESRYERTPPSAPSSSTTKCSSSSPGPRVPFPERGVMVEWNVAQT